MNDAFHQHCSLVDQRISRQNLTLPNISPSDTYLQYRAHDTTQVQAMAQQTLQRQFAPERDINSRAWMSQQVMQRSPAYLQASTSSPFADMALPTEHSGWSSDMTANNALSWSSGLPTEPLIMSEDSQLGPNSHLSYQDGFATGQNLVGKTDGYGYGAEPRWTLSATGDLQRQPSVFDGSEFDTNASSCSPKSYFSDPSDAGQVFGSGDPTGETVKFGPHQTRQVHTGGMGIVPSVEMSAGSISWPSNLPAQSGLPYYQSLGSTTSFHQSMNDTLFLYPSQGPSDTPSRSCGSDIVPRDMRQDHPPTDKTADNQAKRDEENRLLVEGKAQGLTYKQIRDKMQNPVAESTLRGRYRSLVKPRQERVRKPVWKEKDLLLLREIVATELDRLGDCGRTLNNGQRLGKIPWKKVAEYIAERGGSYHFGNSTCKKKWSEINNR